MRMARIVLALFLVNLVGAVCAQAPDSPVLEPLPPPGPPVEVAPDWEGPESPLVETELQNVIIPGVVESSPYGDHAKSLTDFWGYRYEANMSEWIVGDGDQFGMFSFDWNHYQAVGYESGLSVGIGLRWLAGPERTDLPPRIYDFGIGYQTRDVLGPLSYDLSLSVFASSDFEGSSRDGIRFPAHAVGYLSLSNTVELVFGADYLDRDDISVLPVGGIVWLPHPYFRFELVFPNPKAYFQLTEKQRLFLNGGLGGSTWAVERDTLEDDLLTYRDLRLGIGIEQLQEDDGWSIVEIAYLFDRQLEFASGDGDYRPNGTVMIRMVGTY